MLRSNVPIAPHTARPPRRREGFPATANHLSPRDPAVARDGLETVAGSYATVPPPPQAHSSPPRAVLTPGRRRYPICRRKRQPLQPSSSAARRRCIWTPRGGNRPSAAVKVRRRRSPNRWGRDRQPSLWTVVWSPNTATNHSVGNWKSRTGTNRPIPTFFFMMTNQSLCLQITYNFRVSKSERGKANHKSRTT